MKKLCSLLMCFALVLSSMSALAAKDYSSYTPVENVGHCVNFDSDYSSLLAVNGSVEVADVSEFPLITGNSGAEGSILKLNLSGNYSSAPYVASGDSGNGMLSYEQSKDMTVCVSADMAFSNPMLVWSFFQTKGWSSAAANTWMNGYAQMQVSGGKLIAAGKTIDGITIEKDVFHNYKMIIDIADNMAYFYFDGNCVHENSLEGSGMLGFARWAANFPKSYSEDTYVYFDNVTLQTITNSFSAQLITDENPDACAYEYPDIALKFSAHINEETLSSITVKDVLGNSVDFRMVYDEDKNQYVLSDMLLKPGTKYLIDISGVRAGEAAPSGTTVFDITTKFAQGPDINTLAPLMSAGHDVGFDSDYTNSLVTSGDVSVEDVGGEHGKVLKLSLSGSYDSAPYVASSDSGNGILTYKQAEGKIALVSMDMLLSDPSLTWTFFQSKGWSSTTANSWMNGYAQMQVSGGKLIAAGDTVPGVEIKADEFYNYMMVVDVPGQVVYFYLNGICVHQKSIAGSGMLGYARWAASFPKSYSKDTYAYFDNVELRVLGSGYGAEFVADADTEAVPYDKKMNFSVRFSENMDSSSVKKIIVTDSSGRSIAFDGSFDSDLNVYTISGLNLKPYTKYTVDLSKVCSADGFGMSGGNPYFTFTTMRTPVYIEDKIQESNGYKLLLNNRTDDAVDVIAVVSYYSGGRLISCSTASSTVSPGGSDCRVGGKPDNADSAILYLIYKDNFNLIEKVDLEQN